MDSEEWIDGDDARHFPWAALVALLGGCLLLVAAAIAVPHLLSNAPFAALVGGGAVLGAAAWLVALPLGLRHASMPGKIGALLLLVAGGCVAGLSAHRTSAATGRQDASSFAEAEIAPDGAITLPGDALGRGPLSKLYAELQAEAGNDRDKERDALAKVDFHRLYSSYLLEQDPSVLKRCDSVSVPKASASRIAGREKERETKLAAAIDGSGLSDTLRNGIRMMAVPQNTDAILANQIASLDVVETECRLLARRSWKDASGYFAFGNAGDLEQYNAIQTRGRALSKTLRELTVADSDRAHQGQEMVRDTLSQ